jgi:hypothetical protein
MASITVTLPNSLSDAANGMVNSAVDQAILKLAEHFNFSAEEARAYIDKISVQPELLTAKDLPFCGQKIPGCCNAIAFRCGLYTQCPKKPQEDGFCRACSTQKSETGSLKYGTIDDRLALSDPMGYANGKVAPFARLMAKNGWTKEYVEASAKALGWTVPSENFIVIKPKRERPKKMEARPLPPLPTEEDAEDAVKNTLADLGVLTRAHVSPSKVPNHDEDEELDEEPLADEIKSIPVPPEAEAAEAAPEAEEPEEDEDHKRGRKGRDYTKLTAADVPALNPSTLRTACTQNGISVEGKKPAALRVELINKLA